MFLNYVNAKRVSIIKVLAEIAQCAQRSDNQVNAITSTTTTTTTLSRHHRLANTISQTVCAVRARRLISIARMPKSKTWIVAPLAYHKGPDTP